MTATTTVYSTIDPQADRPVAAKVWRKGTRIASPDLERDVRRAKTLARWMDARFSLFGYKIGFDSILGLVPVVGDTATSAIALYPLHVARKHGLAKNVQATMAANVLIDWAVGLVPVAGDLFDVAFKANLRNVELLERAAAEATAEGETL